MPFILLDRALAGIAVRTGAFNRKWIIVRLTELTLFVRNETSSAVLTMHRLQLGQRPLLRTFGQAIRIC
jgi:hypothetical protein